MLISFFYHLRAARLNVSIKELLTLLEALSRDVIGPSIDEFYFLSRATLVKDEAQFDRFDRAFGEFFKGAQTTLELAREIPDAWFKQALTRDFSPEELARLEKLGWDRLMEELRKRLEEQRDAHHGGSKWIGSGGTSPFGHGGAHPEGIRIGGPSRGNRSAVKVWEARAYRDYDDQVELGTRNIKVALRRLRRFARQGAELELDLPDTIAATARNAGWLDLKLVPQRHNAVKVLMLLDVGGTMDEHVKRVEELFSAARAELKHLEFYYFHNCVYEGVWRNNRRRYAERTDTWDLLRKYNPDYRLVFVGDATMSPYEILQPGGSVEHNNPEAGAVWLQRLTSHFTKFAWINPEPEGLWGYRQSVSLVNQLVSGRMYPLTLEGLGRAMRELSK
ncbi:MAG TPA: VWA domain-containing protein [Burkholderiaceae bacterium]|nr:VWA domain-containing protein [Burkholderiaceae bacterium]